MTTLEVISTLTLDDWRAYQQAWADRLRLRSPAPRYRFLVVVGIAFVLAMALTTIAGHFGQAVPFAAVAVGACAAVIAITLNLRRMRTATQPSDPGVLIGHSQMRFDAEGIHLIKTHSTIRHDWALLQEVTRTPTHLFVWVDRIAALIVPVRDLPAGVTADEATVCIQALAINAASVAGTAPDAAEPRAAPLEAAIQPTVATRQNFFASIARLLALRTTNADALVRSDGALLTMAVGCVGFWLLLDWLTAGDDAQFYVFGVVILGWYAFVVALTALLWSRLSEPQAGFRGTLALALAFVPIATVLAWFATRYLPDTATLGTLILIAVYATLYAGAGLRTLTSRVQPRALFSGLLVLSFAAWLGQAQYVTPQLWYPDDDPAGESADDAGSNATRWQQLEPLLFEQAERIDDKVAAIQRPDNVAAAGFFVGFAGMGEQRVFAEEIALAERTVAAKFHTTDRSVLLVNDRRDLNTYPFASATALRRTLKALAQRMNLDQDVLFLSLSSHGSEDAAISVSNGDIPLNNLSAEELADALRESGIRWRVVIVSACYSGTFIEPLRDDQTIVITASAADRTSFGCSDDRDLTYFGEAFYRDALPGARDLRTAFQRMKDLIAARERQENIEPSNPQAWFGPSLERHLRLLN